MWTVYYQHVIVTRWSLKVAALPSQKHKRVKGFSRNGKKEQKKIDGKRIDPFKQEGFEILLEEKKKRGFLTIVVSVTEPKLLMKILQVTFTGGPADRNAADLKYQLQVSLLYAF